MNRMIRQNQHRACRIEKENAEESGIGAEKDGNEGNFKAWRVQVYTDR